MVVVPRAPGPLVSLDVDRRRRDPDDLDDLIDELLPDVDDPPGWFDVGLIGVGAGLLLWVAIGSPPTIVLPAGIVALSLGCILPARTVWRRVRQGRQRRRRAAVLSTGVPLDVSSPVSRRLVQAYEDVLRAARGQDLQPRPRATRSDTRRGDNRPPQRIGSRICVRPSR